MSRQEWVFAYSVTRVMISILRPSHLLIFVVVSCRHFLSAAQESSDVSQPSRYSLLSSDPLHVYCGSTLIFVPRYKLFLWHLSPLPTDLLRSFSIAPSFSFPPHKSLDVPHPELLSPSWPAMAAEVAHEHLRAYLVAAAIQAQDSVEAEEQSQRAHRAPDDGVAIPCADEDVGRGHERGQATDAHEGPRNHTEDVARGGPVVQGRMVGLAAVRVRLGGMVALA